MDSRKKRIHLVFQGIGVLAAVAAAIWIGSAWDYEAFLEWKREAGALPFFAAMAVLPALGLPTTPFYLLAGATFGTIRGFLGSAASTAINLSLCYWIARSGLRPLLEKLLARTPYQLPALRSKRKSLRFALVAKAMPGVPAFAKNYLMCLGGVPFPVYFAISYGLSMTYAAAFVVMGESLLERDFGEASGALAALVLLAILIWAFRRRMDEES
jgi:uncharacterized membrane protein YdjX (TVP38/TMEM64 family)